HRGEDHEVDLAGIDARRLQRSPGSGHSQIGGADAGIDVVARLDAAALADPGVARVHEARQHVVGHAVARNLRPTADDDGALHRTLRSHHSDKRPCATAHCREPGCVLLTSGLVVLTDLSITPIAEMLRRLAYE